MLGMADEDDEMALRPLDPLLHVEADERRTTRLALAWGLALGLLVPALGLYWIMNTLPPDDLGLTFEAERHPVRFFNWHPLLMMTAFGLTLSQALLAFRLCDLPWRTRKIVHVALHVGSIVFMSLGLAAIVRFKRVMGETQFFSVHSWVGISTFSAYVLQFTLGAAFILWPRLFLWLLPAHESFIREALPWHVLAGLAIFLGAAVTTITGLLNRQWLFIVFNEADGDLFSARFMVAGVAALAVLLLAWTVYFHHKGKPSYSHRRDVTA